MSNNLSDQLIYHRSGHASHQRIQRMDKVGIYTGLPKSIPKIFHPCHACIFANVFWPINKFLATFFYHEDISETTDGYA